MLHIQQNTDFCYKFDMVQTKVIIEKSRGEISLMEQDTIEHFSSGYNLAYENFKVFFHIFLIHQNVPQIASFHLRYMMVS